MYIFTIALRNWRVSFRFKPFCYTFILFNYSLLLPKFESNENTNNNKIINRSTRKEKKHDSSGIVNELTWTTWTWRFIIQFRNYTRLMFHASYSYSAVSDLNYKFLKKVRNLEILYLNYFSFLSFTFFFTFSWNNLFIDPIASVFDQRLVLLWSKIFLSLITDKLITTDDMRLILSFIVHTYLC